MVILPSGMDYMVLDFFIYSQMTVDIQCTLYIHFKLYGQECYIPSIDRNLQHLQFACMWINA